MRAATLSLFSSHAIFIESIEPSCGYLGIIPVGGMNNNILPGYTSYADFVNFTRGGFAVQFPMMPEYIQDSPPGPRINWFGLIKKCLNESVR